MQDSDPFPRYLVVEGPIGVGKTSLAKRLADTLGSALILERPQQNPFLERFYRDPRSGAFPTQLHFLFQRARQIQALRQEDLFASRRIADFLLDKDPLFARETLDDEEFSLYQQVYAKLALDAPDPDLVVYLQAPVGVLLKRIIQRGIAYEQSITPAYLQRISDAYTRFFHQYDRSALLIVNAGDIDLLTNEAQYRELVAAIRAARSGRRYFNPGTSALL